MDELVETRVIFKILEGEVIAFLLDMDANYGHILSYMHIGQHGEASMGCYWKCKPATEEQYKDLKEELENMGYKLSIRKRFNRTKSQWVI